MTPRKALFVLAACHGAMQPAPAVKDAQAMTTTPNDQLVSKVRAAVTAKVAFDTLEASVGEKALVNTLHGPPIENLRRLSIVRDPEHPDEHISLKTAKAIIYWDRHVAGSEDPYVVGVQQNPDGTTTMFFGIITPP
jgi:hypothetical protein